MEGVQYRKCTVCNTYMETKAVDKREHDFSKKRILKQPTCEEDGMRETFCAACGACSSSGTEAIPALGHSYPEQWKVETEASCTEGGIRTRTCATCGNKETEVLEETGHEFRESRYEPNGMQMGQIIRICKVCNYSETEFFYNEMHAGVVEVASGSYVKAGDTITVPIKITDNPGILGFHFTMRYNKDVITPQSISQTTFEEQVINQYAAAGEVLTSGELNTTVKADNTGGSGTNEALNISWYHISEMEEDGVLFQVKFKVNENSGTTVSELLLTCDNMVGEENASIIPTIKDGEITIVDASDTKLKRGDIYIDSKVDERDGILLAKYLVNRAGVLLSKEQLDAADVYIDGKVNTKDSVRLAQLISGWEFTETDAPINAVSLAAEAAIRLGSSMAQPGEYVDVPITIENNPGIAGFHLKLNYDKEYLTPVSVDAGNIVGSDIVTNLPEEESEVTSLDALSLQWNEPDNITEDGLLCTVQFKVADDYPEGQPMRLQLECEESDPVCCVAGTDIIDADIRMHSGGINWKEEEDAPSEPYEIKQVSLSVDGQEAVFEIPSQGAFDVAVEFQKLAEELVPADVILAAYDEEGRLIATKAKTLNIQMLLDGKCSFHMEEMEAGIGSLKIFMWDSANGMKPMANYYQIE